MVHLLLPTVVCYLSAGAAGVQEDAFQSHSLDAFLASDFLEDAQPKEARVRNVLAGQGQRPSAPHDVGNLAVKLPNGFEAWEAKMKAAQAKMKLETQAKRKLSLADTGAVPARHHPVEKAGPHAKSGAFFDDEDSAPRQEFSRMPEDQEPAPALFEGIAARTADRAAYEDVADTNKQEL